MFWRPVFWLIGLLLVIVCPALAAADGTVFDSVELSGYVASEGRVYVEDAQFPDQFDGFQASLLTEPELEFDSGGGQHQFSLVPFFRLDSRDRERSHWDIREAYWRFSDSGWELLAGFNRIFWGVTESRHLVNVVNQIDLLEDVDQEDFLGQLMVQFASQQDWGRMEGFLLVGFRGLRFPGPDGRLRPALPVDDGFDRWNWGFERAGPDLALRYAHYIGAWDVGLSYFYGTGREPRLVFAPNLMTLQTEYETIHQGGLDLQLTTDAWLWKLEAIIREGHGPVFAAAVGGFEYTFYQVFESDADFGVLAEYLFDGRDSQQAPPTTSDRDFFLGTRLTLNDFNDSSMLLGAIVDHRRGFVAISLEGERRLASHWKAELESRLFLNVDSLDPLAIFENDDYFVARISYFF